MSVPRLTITVSRRVNDLYLLKINVLEILITLLDSLFQLLEVLIVTCHVLLLGSLALVSFTRLLFVTLVICLVEGRQHCYLENWHFLLCEVLYKVCNDRPLFLFFLEHFVNEFSETL